MCNTKPVVTQVSVIDPANRTGKVDIPREKVFNTLGMRQYLAAKGSKANHKNAKKQFSLCMLFQKGKCRSGSRCHQIHADKDFVNALRDACSETTKCCCDDKCQEQCDLNETSLPATFRLVLGDNGSEQHVYPVSLLGRTLGTTKTSSTGSDSEVLPSTSPAAKPASSLIVEQKKLCRLHIRGCCLFGRDCKNVHICRRVLKRLGLAALEPSDTDIESTTGQTFTFTFPSMCSPLAVSSPKSSVQSPNSSVGSVSAADRAAIIAQAQAQPKISPTQRLVNTLQESTVVPATVAVQPAFSVDPNCSITSTMSPSSGSGSSWAGIARGTLSRQSSFSDSESLGAPSATSSEPPTPDKLHLDGARITSVLTHFNLRSPQATTPTSTQQAQTAPSTVQSENDQVAMALKSLAGYATSFNALAAF
eukprot:TRINITY_DN93514_c0_g1_i1.p1 TRINITY_DN93514_c0_g1~~TRINITY_DN93514_c0_g1_i1.p1  ORF type:complete len:420 (-),score=34.89 TRINITY_DN93514_c0_g1_i1:704-1963(-)